MATQRRDAAIVGMHEYPKRVVGPSVSAQMIKVASARRALEDAGLTWKDVDALYDPDGGLNMAEYFGFRPQVVDTTSVGGASFEFLTGHALRSIREGKCKVVLISEGSTAHSDQRAIGTGGFAGGASPQGYFRLRGESAPESASLGSTCARS